MRGVGGRAGVIVAALAAIVLLVAAVPATAARPAVVRVALIGADRDGLAKEGAVAVKVVAARTSRVTLAATGNANGALALVAPRTLRTKHRRTLRQVIRLPLTDHGRTLIDACEPVDIVVTARAGKATATATTTLPPATDRLSCRPAPNAPPAPTEQKPNATQAPQATAPTDDAPGPTPDAQRPEPGKPDEPTYRVGVASRSINPNENGTYDGANVYLGGYGIGGGSQILQGRPATGYLGDGLHVRAIAVSDGTHQVAIADAELQGWFVKTNDGLPGILDVRKAVEQRTHGAIKASQVIVQSDHTHGGPDLMGVWGGAPDAYRRYVAKQTEDAIVDAIAGERPATLSYGAVDGRDLLSLDQRGKERLRATEIATIFLQSNQFDYDAANKVMDSDVRLLRASDPQTGRPFATLLNFSAHATVLGSSNTKATGDWVQEANTMLEQRFGGRAVTVVGTLGRTQPADRGCSTPGLTGDAASLCTLDDYAGRVVDRAAQAADAATPIDGAPLVDARSYLITDPSSSAFLLGILIAGKPIGLPLNRSETPPWLTANVLGTTTQSARIGDVLLSAAPGEMYPQIPLAVRGIAGGLRGYMTAGLAGDQLGYLIAPYESYTEPIKTTFFTPRGDEVSPLDNDNYAFNVSHTIGERVTCSLLRGAGDLFGKGEGWRSADDRCAPFVNDDVLPAGSDVTAP